MGAAADPFSFHPELRDKISDPLTSPSRTLTTKKLAALTKFFEADPQLGIVMASGVQDDERVAKALELGAYGYVLKPFDFLYLELVVSSRLAIAQKV